MDWGGGDGAMEIDQMPSRVSETSRRQWDLDEDEEDAMGDPSEGKYDWECPDCSFVNFAYRTDCRECLLMRPSNVKLIRFSKDDVTEARPGDWLCLECNFSNYSTRKECKECRYPRPAGIGADGPEGGRGRDGKASASARPGDWNCPECDFSNFESRWECKKCRCPRPGSRYDQARIIKNEGRPGDWECPECRFVNYASRWECMKCYLEKPMDAGRGGGGPMPPRGQQRGGDQFMVGDWECPTCRYHNFASRDDCGGCHEPRPAGSGKVRKGRDWTCVECGYVNFGSRSECKDCLLERPSPTQRGDPTRSPQRSSCGPVSLDRRSPPPSRALPSQRGRSLRPGEWQCGQCGFDNFASRVQCFKCGVDK